MVVLNGYTDYTTYRLLVLNFDMPIIIEREKIS